MEEEPKKIYCSECGSKIEDNYYKCLDNFLQVNFFDTEEENYFCSEDCFCKYMSLEQLDIECIKKTQFKDKCDECGEFDFLKSYNRKCLCKDCSKQYEMPIQEKQLNLFDMEVLNNGKQPGITSSIK